MKTTTYIANFLYDKKIDTIFELQGGMITRMIDEIFQQGKIKIVSMHHEQAAAFAVDSYARVTNKPGVAFATSGPGATNLITGIGSCYFDSVPAIFITGQVNLDEQKGDRLSRQIGFQETEIIPMVKPITKAAFAVKSANEIPDVFNKAYKIALQGRPGPVVIDIPMNIQNQEINAQTQYLTHEKEPSCNISEIHLFIKEYINALRHSKRPLILVGRGVRISGSTTKLMEFIEKFNIPVVTSLLGFDSIPYQHPNRIGLIGTYGNRWSNYALGLCDVLLVLGSRLDLRQTGSDIDSFKKDKKIFHIDIDNAELNNRITGCYCLQSDLEEFFNEVNNSIPFKSNTTFWKNEIFQKYRDKKDIDELTNINGINPNIFIHQLAQSSILAKVITTDVGNNQMWSAQSFELKMDQLFLSSGGMGAMGYSLPAAIGACYATNNSPVVCIAGDGGFQINIQELQTVCRNNLPIKIVILNNHCLGMIRQFQDSYFNSCYQSTVWGYSSPDFTKLALAYGINSFSIEKIEDVELGLKKLWENPLQPFLLNVNLDIQTNVYPKIKFGNPISEMEP